MVGKCKKETKLDNIPSSIHSWPTVGSFVKPLENGRYWHTSNLERIRAGFWAATVGPLLENGSTNDMAGQTFLTAGQRCPTIGYQLANFGSIILLYLGYKRDKCDKVLIYNLPWCTSCRTTVGDFCDQKEKPYTFIASEKKLINSLCVFSHV